MAAIIYKCGPSAPVLVEWFAMREQTIYRGSTVSTKNYDHAIQDRQRSGRPRKLDKTDWGEFRHALQSLPEEGGHNQLAWTTALARLFLEDKFDGAYSHHHIQRLLKGAGLS